MAEGYGSTTTSDDDGIDVSASEKSFITFLTEDRKLPEETVKMMMEEKLDSLTVADMSDAELEQFIPKLGDRIAVRQYCSREKEVHTNKGGHISNTLLDKIRGKKRKAFGGNFKDVRSTKLSGNRNAVRQKRRFELGWKDFNGEEFSQVRQPRGGGTRHLKLNKDTTMSQVKENAIKLFFPNGKSKLGKVDDFEITLRDHQDDIIDLSTTLLGQIERTKFKMLRVYIFTKHVEETKDVQKSKSPNSTTSVVTPGSSEMPQNMDLSVEGDQSNIPGTSGTSHQYEVFLGSSDEEVLFSQRFPDDAMFNDTLPFDFFRDTLTSDPHSMNASSPTEKKVEKLKLHRGQVFEELNKAVKNKVLTASDSTVEIEMVLPNGTVEKGEDTGGVLRDGLSEYWDTFYKKCTTGNSIKVPITRHDMTDTWEHVAGVLIIGYKTAGYFPILLAKPFINHCYGHETQEEELVNTFLQVIPEHERKIIEQALQDFQSVSGDDEFLDMLDSHEVKSCVRQDNFKNILAEVAHKELIQDPAYISECWQVPLKQHMRKLLQKAALDELYDKLKPTPKKVISIFQFEEHLDRKQQSISTFLKKFIRQCPKQRLLKFLRFCTGADVLIAPYIKVRFVEPLSDFSRTPTSHTCGYVLELPNTYGSYIELAEEVSELLDSKVWVMDIV